MALDLAPWRLHCSITQFGSDACFASVDRTAENLLRHQPAFNLEHWNLADCGLRFIPARAYAKIITDVNRLDLKDLQRPPAKQATR